LNRDSREELSVTQLSGHLSGVLSIRTISHTNTPAYPVLAHKKFLRAFPSSYIQITDPTSNSHITTVLTSNNISVIIILTNVH